MGFLGQGLTFSRRKCVSCKSDRGTGAFSACSLCPQDKADLLKDALNAAWPGMAENATVVDWEGNVLREGSNGFDPPERAFKTNTIPPTHEKEPTPRRGSDERLVPVGESQTNPLPLLFA